MTQLVLPAFISDLYPPLRAFLLTEKRVSQSSTASFCLGNRKYIISWMQLLIQTFLFPSGQGQDRDAVGLQMDFDTVTYLLSHSIWSAPFFIL